MILLDTNVVSEVMKATPAEVVLHWLNQQESSALHVSTITIGEIAYGLRILPDGKRRTALNDKFDQFIAQAFAQRIIEYDESGRPYLWRDNGDAKGVGAAYEHS